jgi:hypothetical protein
MFDPALLRTEGSVMAGRKRIPKVRMTWTNMSMDVLMEKVGKERTAKRAAYSDIMVTKVEAGQAHTRYMEA